ncbi:MAG: hypothetical protein JSU82_09515 [Rhodospirillales bacterium]|nr:MAG: hypothetical protein JSU82_09515 [Rhodospirillales bacterium]
MSRTRGLLSIPLLVALAGCPSYWHSPLVGIPVGAAGPPSPLSVVPDPSPSTVLRVTTSRPVGANETEWVLIPMTMPAGRISNVKVCYQIVAEKPGTTYISQVRLTRTTTPDVALVIHDDPTDLTSTTPTCHLSKSGADVAGTTTLALRMVFGSKSDLIRIGGIELQR